MQYEAWRSRGQGNIVLKPFSEESKVLLTSSYTIFCNVQESFGATDFTTETRPFHLLLRIITVQGVGLAFFKYAGLDIVGLLMEPACRLQAESSSFSQVVLPSISVYRLVAFLWFIPSYRTWLKIAESANAKLMENFPHFF